MTAVDIRPLKAESVYAIDDPDCCYCIEDATEILDDWSMSQGEARHVGLVREVAQLWMIYVPTAVDEDGWVEEREARYFNTQAEAQDAFTDALEALRGPQAAAALARIEAGTDATPKSGDND